MADEQHLKILKQGVMAWNQWRIDNPDVKPNLTRTDLAGMDLSGANLTGAEVSEADISGSYLSGVYLNGANLYGANLFGSNLSGATGRGAFFIQSDLVRADFSSADLSGAWLSKADLSKANLSNANLRQVDLSDADITGAHLNGADLGEATLANTIVVNVDLSQVQGLESIEHHGPSEISISTIYRSQGKIPLTFLQGTGVPDNFIEYMHSLVGTAFEFYSCFISYSGHDQEFADRVYEGLQNNGVRCWFAPHHVQAGKKLHEQIDDAIRLHERLLLILSPNSIKSEWVKTEIAKARKREIREGRRVLFPISLNIPYQQLQDWECFDADTSKDSAREIREYYIPDFTHWEDHKSFRQEFKKLLHDLKKPNTAKAGA